mmetsp:Transcript_24096/g.60710  ORF Transcript_24096/g.60710 Transcript_24096/m.60710 type:complete len:80 (+) Transcript_24096:3462-3701(+)
MRAFSLKRASAPAQQGEVDSFVTSNSKRGGILSVSGGRIAKRKIAKFRIANEANYKNTINLAVVPAGETVPRLVTIFVL